MNTDIDILIVEDSDLDAEMAKEAVTSLKHSNRYLHFWNGEDALDYLLKEGDYANRKSGHPQVILLDIKMPRISGFEVLEKLNESAMLSYVPVVMMSSSDMPEDVAMAYNYGAKSFIKKPNSYTEYLLAVKKAVHYWTNLNELP